MYYYDFLTIVKERIILSKKKKTNFFLNKEHLRILEPVLSKTKKVSVLLHLV